MNSSFRPANHETDLQKQAPAGAPDPLLERGAILRQRYRLLERIGEGSIGRVYRAIDLHAVETQAPERYVAVKVLTVPFTDIDEAMKLLAREAHSLRGTAHPNIARILDCDRDGDIVFMTLELLSGQSLLQKVHTAQATGLPRPAVFAIVRDIAQALGFAHSKNIIHGDLKPGNVIITEDGVTKVTDFGLAHLANLPTQTQRQRMLGSVPDPRDDVFALACTTWILMTGKHPFKGKTLRAAREQGMELASTDELSRREFRALQHALQFSREQRTSSVLQFVQELSGQEIASQDFSGDDRKGSRLLMPAAVALAVIGLIAAGLLVLKPWSRPTPVSAAPPAVRVDAANSPAVPASVFRDCPTCPQMKLIPAGTFLQGSVADDPQTQPFELPQHPVAIGRAFAVGVYDVTVEQYAQFIAATGDEAHACLVYDGSWHTNDAVNWSNAVESQTARHPVSCVSWRDAKRYAAWLSNLTGHTYRLPSASEWEYAARAGSSASRPWGDPHAACAYANLADITASQRFPGWTFQPCVDGYAQSAPVGSFSPNAFGLYDTLGNVFQWVDDCWVDGYHGAPSDGSARSDGDCTQRELRGGSWFTRPDYVRVSYRNHFAVDYRSTSVGFRVVREVMP
jgi:formylglycine-generating enzyme required for sulfatase activity